MEVLGVDEWLACFGCAWPYVDDFKDGKRGQSSRFEPSLIEELVVLVDCQQ
ncbi:polyketide synthase [Aspergillus luchuensis]|uniref:Polyketide synthase n=1 Tax=Aspergillus kawachii TaxID=1069201 RepID=A0A146FEQ8_ASPKA|nr:polyketide synthase [Aspergillus luchuensis]